MTDFRVTVKVANFTGAMTRIGSKVAKIDRAARTARQPVTLEMAERVKKQIESNLSTGSRQNIIWQTPLIPVEWIQYSEPPGVPGRFPATQSGALLESMVIHQGKIGMAQLIIGEGLDRPYAAWLEFGFTSIWARNFQKFPFIRPSFEEVKDELPDIALGTFRDHLWGHL